MTGNIILTPLLILVFGSTPIVARDSHASAITVPPPVENAVTILVPKKKGEKSK